MNGDARSEFLISANHLDREWLRQSELVYSNCMKLAEAKQELDEAKANLEIVEAECDRDIRLHPSRYGMEKTSEPRIRNAVVLTKQYQAANKEVIEAKHEVDVLTAAVNALDHKKRALENLVHLYHMAYFGDPKVDDDAQETLKESRRDRILKPKTKETK